MRKKERQEFIKKELQAIYDEFNVCTAQLNIMKPFIKDLVDVANGADPIYDLVEFLPHKKKLST